MNSYINRQLCLLSEVVSEYQSEKITLNQMVNKLDSITEVMNSESWKDDVFNIYLALEEVNAVTLDENRQLNNFEKNLISEKLFELKLLIEKYSKIRTTNPTE